jgi:hypothetical protein
MLIPMWTRARTWLKSPAEKRRRKLQNALAQFAPWMLPLRFGFARLVNIFWSYLPDSYTTFGEHSEFRPLFARFSRHNKPNNAGDSVRLWALVLNIKQVLEEGVEGEFAELGVWRGNTAAVLAHFAVAAKRTVYLFDTFTGFDRRDINNVDSNVRPTFSDTSVAIAQDVIGPGWSACRVVAGYFPESVEPEHKATRYAIVSIDCDLYEPMKAGLDFFYPRMPIGGLLMLHDYSSLHWPGVKQAIDEFCATTGESVILMPDKSGSAFIRRAR